MAVCPSIGFVKVKTSQQTRRRVRDEGMIFGRGIIWLAVWMPMGLGAQHAQEVSGVGN